VENKTDTERILALEINQEILYSKQNNLEERFEERFEKMNESLNSLVQLKSIIMGACLIMPLCCGLLWWTVSRAIILNDGMDTQQQQMINAIQVEHSIHEKAIQQLENIINKHFK
jgi:hypothetical protein